VVLKQGATESVKLVVGADPEAGPVTPAPTPPPVATAPPSPPEENGGSLVPLIAISAGVGAGGLAVFTVFGGAIVGTVWFAIAFIVEKATGRRAAVAPPSETPEGEAAPLAFGAHVPFGPMLAIAGALYFLLLRDATLRWFAEVSVLF